MVWSDIISIFPPLPFLWAPPDTTLQLTDMAYIWGETLALSKISSSSLGYALPVHYIVISQSVMHWPINYIVHHIVNECTFWICPQCSERNMNLWILQVTKPFHLCMSEGLNMDAVCCLEAILSSFFNLKINFPKSDEHKRRDEGNQMSTRKMLNTLRQRWDNNSNFLLLWNVRKTLKYEKLIHSYVNMSVYCVLLYPLICCDKDRLELLPLHDT